MKISKAKKSVKAIKPPTWKEQGYVCARYFVAVMAFLGTSFLYMLRLNMNLTIIAMVKPSNRSENEENVFNSCNIEYPAEVEGEEYTGTFTWDEFTQSLILGSFSWGYFWLQIPGGRLSEIIGPRRVIGYSILGSAILTLFVPLASHTSPTALMIVRFLMGLSQGPCPPSTHTLLAIWAPSQELSLLSTIIYAGRQFGTIIAFPVAALIINSFGWEYVFYIQAFITILWGIAWFLFVTDKPQDFRWISEAEKEYLEKSKSPAKTKKSPPLPWKSILTSVPFLAIIIAGLGNNWGFFTLVTDLPLYMKNMLRTDISSVVYTQYIHYCIGYFSDLMSSFKQLLKNAKLSGLPYLGMWIFSLLFSTCADYLMRTGILSKTWVRKLATLIVTLIFVAITLQGGIYSGWLINAIDIAPNFAGTLYGITNALASIPSWVAPMVVGTITNHNETFASWRTIFFISGGFFIFDAIFFLIFGSGKVQEWNFHKEKKYEKSEQQKDEKLKENGSSLSQASSIQTIEKIV
ncbi:Sialin [Armadillidium nasatum]|uniref:Sialin n=1 Tax=Armadillidium nasatum TaxID=96803 RepID=A0A5N5SNU7_9CRUS|nr:Sialin [Armadillidium nasatum]